VEPAERVLVIKKPDLSLLPALEATVQYLLAVEHKLIVHIEEHVLCNEIDPRIRCSRLRSVVFRLFGSVFAAAWIFVAPLGD
jgi:hypothetical protein